MGVLLTFFPWGGGRDLLEGGGLFERGCLIEDLRYALILLSSPSVVTVLEIFSYIAMYYLQDLVPSTINRGIAGQKYYPRDRGVLTYHMDPYLTTTQKDHRAFTK